MSLEFISNEHSLFPTPLWQVQIKGVDNEALKEYNDYVAAKEAAANQDNIETQEEGTTEEETTVETDTTTDETTEGVT